MTIILRISGALAAPKAPGFFSVGDALFLPQKLMTFISHPQYTGYPPKLTTRSLPHPIILF